MSSVASARVVMAGATASVLCSAARQARAVGDPRSGALTAPARGSYAVSNVDRRLIVDRRGRRPGGNSAAVHGTAVWWWWRPADTERQILLRVDRAVGIGERELRYQLDRKDNHPLAQAEELLDVLVELEDLGLVESELCFGLTAEGRARLADPAGGGCSA
jgi:hypothetical protein